MEAESFHQQQDLQSWWVLENSIAGYTGMGYLRMTGNKDSGGKPLGRLLYHFTINTNGVYRLMMHAYKATIDDRTDLANDCYTKLTPYTTGGYIAQDTKFYLGGNRADQWGWAVRHETKLHTYQKTDYILAPGNYTLEVSGRSRNFRLNRIIFYESKLWEENKVTPLSLKESGRDGTVSSPTAPTNAPITTTTTLTPITSPTSISLNLILMNASTIPAQRIRKLQSNRTINLDDTGTGLSIQCVPQKDRNRVVQSVIFTLGNGNVKTDTDGRPFTITSYQNSNGQYASLPYFGFVGSKTITAQAYDTNGNLVGSTSVTFSMVLTKE